MKSEIKETRQALDFFNTIVLENQLYLGKFAQNNMKNEMVSSFFYDSSPYDQNAVSERAR